MINSKSVLPAQEVKMQLSTICLETLELFKNIAKQNRSNGRDISYLVQNYSSHLYDVLNDWDTLGNNIFENINSINNINSVIGKKMYVINTNYIYGVYDFASPIQYIDGVIKGLKSETFKDIKDINNFMNYTLGKAYEGIETYTRDTDAIMKREIFDNTTKDIDALDLQKFYLMKNNRDWISSKNRYELYQSILKVIDVMQTSDLLSAQKILNIQSMFSVATYIVYSISIYVARIYSIWKYASVFIDEYRIVNADNITTSVIEAGIITLSDIGENCDDINIFGSMDEHSLKNDMLFIAQFQQFLTKIDCKVETSPSGINILKDVRNINLNKVFNKSGIGKLLNKNLLFDLLYSPHDSNADCMEVQSQTFRQLEALVGVPSLNGKYQECRDTIIAIIRDYNCDFNITAYKYLSFDYYILTRIWLSMVDRAMNDSKYIVVSKDYDSIESNELFSMERISLHKKILVKYDELKFEVLHAIMSKMRLIERGINMINNSKSNESKYTESASSITEFIESVNDSILPETYAIDLYYENLSNNDLFSNDMFITEGVADLVDKVIAFLKGVLDKIVNSYKDKKFQAVKKWVVDNEQTLRNLNYPSDIKIDYLPYKDNIELPEGFSKFTTGLKNFNAESLKDLEKYIEGIYPNDKVRDWFKNKPDEAPQKYLNLILFNNESEKPLSTSVATATDLPKLMSVWIDTIKTSEKTIESFRNVNDDITKSMLSIKGIIRSNIKDTKSNPTSHVAMDTTASSSSATNTTNTTANNTGDSSNGNTAVLAIQKAIQRLWIPIAHVVINVTFNQYNYIKNTYQMCKNTTNTNTNQAGSLL